MDNKEEKWFWTPSAGGASTWFRGGPESKEKAANIYNMLGIRYRRKVADGYEYCLDYDSMKKEVDQ
jgi:hypothetical protein